MMRRPASRSHDPAPENAPRITPGMLRTLALILSKFCVTHRTASPIGPVMMASRSGQFDRTQFHAPAAARWTAANAPVTIRRKVSERFHAMTVIATRPAIARMTSPIGLAVRAAFSSHCAAVMAPVATVPATMATFCAPVAMVARADARLRLFIDTPTATSGTMKFAIPDARSPTPVPRRNILSISGACCRPRSSCAMASADCASVACAESLPYCRTASLYAFCFSATLAVASAVDVVSAANPRCVS